MSPEQQCILSLLNQSQRGVSTQQVAKDCALTFETALSILGAFGAEKKVTAETWNDTSFWRITPKGKAELELEQRVYEDDLGVAA